MDSNSTVSLGPEISRHALAGGYKWGTLITGVGMIVFGPVVYVLMTYFWLSGGPELAGVLAETPFLNYLPIGLCAILVLVGILRLLALAREWPQQIVLYRDGLVYRDRSGEKAIPWEEVTTLLYYKIRHYQGLIPTGMTHQTTITLKNGVWITITSPKFNRARQFGESASAVLAEYLVPRYYAEIQAGKPVQFNSELSMDQHGLTCGSKQLAWGEVEKLRVDAGKIAVRKNGKWSTWAHIDLTRTPQFFLIPLLAGKFVPVE